MALFGRKILCAYRKGELEMRNFVLVLFLCFTIAFSITAFAQKGPCTEQGIQKAIVVATKSDADFVANYVADDAYFFSGALEKPVVGKSNVQKAGEPVAASRKNEKWDAEKPDRIVVAPGGNMAYEYGTDHGSFDEKQTGKHQDFTAAYLRVWKNVGGSCKVVAEMAQPEGER
jgi:ketosteroid isomerase-like protein